MTAIGKSITKAAAIAAAAAGLGGGAAVVYNQIDRTPGAAPQILIGNAVYDADPEYIPPVVVNLPEVVLPEVKLPEIEPVIVKLPEIKTIEIKTIETVSFELVQTLNLPEVEPVAVAGTTSDLLVALESFNKLFPTLKNDAPDKSDKSVLAALEEFNKQFPTLKNEVKKQVFDYLAERIVKLPEITLPEVKKLDNEKRIEQWMALVRIHRTFFRDQRNLQYDKSANIDSRLWARWIAVYKAAQKQTFVMEQVKMRNGLRMIAEVTVPENAEEIRTLDANLDRYAARGYNAALLTFDTSEKLYQLIDLAELIKSKGMACWIAYSGPEDLRHSVFVEPDKLTKYLSVLAKISDGFLIGWRRTALHLLIQDKAFTDLMLKSVRTGNPSIAVLGESYLGPTAEVDNEHPRIASHNVPANASGTMVNNIGFQGVNVKGALKGVFESVAHMDRVAVIVGSKPYHMTLHKTAETRERQDAIKQTLERRFRAAGCVGTITLHGDGGTVRVDGKNKITDSLCR